MVSKLLLLFLLLLSGSILCQLIENTPFQQYQEFPHAEIKNFGMGNYGFDASDNQYNPYYHKNEFRPSSFLIDPFLESPHLQDSTANFYLSFGGNINVAGGRNLTSLDKPAVPLLPYSNIVQFKPNIIAKYWLKPLQLHFFLTNDYSLAQEQRGDTVVYDFGSAQLETAHQTVNIDKNTMKLAASLLASPKLSLNIGILTSSLNYKWDPGVTNPADYKSGFFKNFQYLFSMSYALSESFRYYVKFKSQKANFDLSIVDLRFDNGFITLPIIYASYYGNIGYGVQKSFGNRLKVSAEMRHQFLEVNDTTGISNAFGRVDQRHIWNNEIILGTKYQLSNKFKIGAIFTTFLKYDNLIYLRVLEEQEDGSETLSLAHISKPLSVALSGRYISGKISLRGIYQYSRNQYDTASRTVIKDSAHFLSINFGYNFSL